MAGFEKGAYRNRIQNLNGSCMVQFENTNTDRYGKMNAVRGAEEGQSTAVVVEAGEVRRGQAEEEEVK
ncbi:hypothetical protein ACFX12_034546 [Malus domestica]